jgi:hypothetical protein
VVRGGKVVALESIDPPGAVRIVGAAMWSAGWFDSIPDQLMMPDPSNPAIQTPALDVYKKALATQANNTPRDSPANPLIHHVAEQIPVANQPSKPEQP